MKSPLLFSLLVLTVLLALVVDVSEGSILRIGALGGFHPLLQWLLGRPKYWLSNWGGNFQFSTQNIQYPQENNEVANLVKNNFNNMRALGSRHSFSKIADCEDMIVNTMHMNQILGLDPSVPSVTIEAGVTYTDLAPFLEIMGFGLPNLASLAEITVVGASQTAAHGSGVTTKILANDIIGMQIALANGTLANITSSNPDLKALAVGLGAFGIITQVTLKLQPTYQMANNVFTNLTVTQLVNNFDEITSAAYVVQFFFDSSDPEIINFVFVGSRLDQSNGTNHLNATQFYGAQAANTQVTPITALPSTYVVEQLGQPGPWYERLVDYRLGLSGFNGAEIQSEYFVPWANATQAILAIKGLASSINPVVYTGFYRTVAADDLWMSHSYNRKTLGIHFTFKPLLDQVKPVVKQIEAALLPFGAVPHWGKLYYMTPAQYLNKYPKLTDWKNLVKKYDPTGKFRNDFVNDNVFVNV